MKILPKYIIIKKENIYQLFRIEENDSCLIGNYLSLREVESDRTELSNIAMYIYSKLNNEFIIKCM